MRTGYASWLCELVMRTGYVNWLCELVMRTGYVNWLCQLLRICELLMRTADANCLCWDSVPRAATSWIQRMLSWTYSPPLFELPNFD